MYRAGCQITRQYREVGKFNGLNFYICSPFGIWSGELAQLARALAWHARGHRFEPGILHALKVRSNAGLFLF